MITSLVDSHAHLFYDDFGPDLSEVLVRARELGVRRVVVPGTREDTCRQAIDLATRMPGIFAAVGIHPHEAAKVQQDEVTRVRELAARSGIVAVGEVGLDHFYDFAPKEVQADLFQRQLGWAVELDLPVIVHTRESMEDAIGMVEGQARANPGWCMRDGESHRGVFHCFTGDAKQARRLFEAGFYVSYPGIVTFKNSPVVTTLKEIGLKRVLVETDSPYLTPVPYRGKRNEPSHVVLIANAIAAILGLPVEEVARRTTRNAEVLFRLPAEV
jgi:TatD DNase family protein